MSTKNITAPCCQEREPCGSGTTEAQKRPGVNAPSNLPARPRFFAGQMVTDADLRAIIDYQRAQLALTVGNTIGWGVSSGYGLTVSRDAGGIMVGAGVAFDALGRALVHGGDTAVPRPSPAQVSTDPMSGDEVSYLAVAFDDHLAAPRPQHGTGTAGAVEPGAEFSRVEERVRFVWVPQIPDSYFTAGRVPEPCADSPSPRPPPERCQYKPEPVPEPMLDQCTPCIGIRGGAGVMEHARRTAHAWNLPRNASLMGAAGTPVPASVGVGALLDVISGMAGLPAAGDPMVVLARVTFSLKEGQPHVAVAPIRRRVLSTADLTYLVAWMLERMLAGPAPGITAVRETVLPPAGGHGGPPTVCEMQDVVRLVSRAVAGDRAGEDLLARARVEASSVVLAHGIGDVRAIDEAMFLCIVERTVGHALNGEERAAAIARHHQLVGRA